VLVVLVILRAGLRRIPLLTLLCVGLLGFALHTGALSLPAAIRTPVAHLSSAVRAWQKRQIAALSCEVAQSSAIQAGDDASLDAALQRCDSGRSSAGR